MLTGNNGLLSKITQAREDIVKKTFDSLKRNLPLIYLLNKDKVHQEIKKCHHEQLLLNYLKELGVNLC